MITMTKDQFDVLYGAYCELYEVVWNMDNSILTGQLCEVDEDVNKMLKELEPQIGSSYLAKEES